MADFMSFKSQFELEMGLEEISQVSTTDYKSTAKKVKKSKIVDN